MGRKELDDGRTRILVLLRGSTGTTEVLSNFNLFETTVLDDTSLHAGFWDAARTVYTSLYFYLNGDWNPDGEYDNIFNIANAKDIISPVNIRITSESGEEVLSLIDGKVNIRVPSYNKRHTDQSDWKNSNAGKKGRVTVTSRKPKQTGSSCPRLRRCGRGRKEGTKGSFKG